MREKNLDNRSELAFDQNSLIEISEIGLATDHIENEFNFLNKTIGLEIYSGDFDRFCAIGNENGLFICVNKNKKDWFPTGDKIFPSGFEIMIHQNENEYKIELKNEKLRFDAKL